MTSIDNLPRINEIYYELGRVEPAIQNLMDGGLIIGITIAPPPPPSLPNEEPLRLAASVETGDMPFSPEAIQALIEGLQARHAQLVAELAELGIN